MQSELSHLLQMTFFQQLRDAIRLLIADFFRVRAPAVFLMLGVIAVLILYVWVRVHFYPSELFGVQFLLLFVVMILLRAAQRYFR